MCVHAIDACHPHVEKACHGVIDTYEVATQDKNVLGRVDLRAAMDKLVPPIKYKQADTIEVLCQKIVEGMHTRKVTVSSEGETSKEDHDSGGGGAKRAAHHDDPAASGTRTRVRTRAGAVGLPPV